MKKILLSFTIIFSMMFTSVSFAEWTLVTTADEGDEYFVDFDRIRKNEGFIYFWWLVNVSLPIPTGNLSFQEYRKVDCKLLRSQRLVLSLYKLKNGVGDRSLTDTTVKDWEYPFPNTVSELVLNSVCK